MRKFIYIILPLFFIGCDDNAIEQTKKLNENNPYLKKYKNTSTQLVNVQSDKNRSLDKKLKFEKLKIDNMQTLAKIQAQKEQKIKEIETKSKERIKQIELKKIEIESNKTLSISKIENQTKIEIKKEESSLYKIFAVILGLILIFWIIIRYLLILAKKRKDIELEEKRMQHEAYLLDIKSKHEHISKMLDIITDEKSDKEIKKSITKILEKGKSNLIEHK